MSDVPEVSVVGAVVGSNGYEMGPFGDSALYLQFRTGDEEEDWKKAHSVINWVRGQDYGFVVSAYATYETAFIEFDPIIVRLEAVQAILDQLLANYSSPLETWLSQTRVFDVPVVYGGHFGMDLEEVASEQGMRTDELIREHTRVPFTIRCFSPGGGAMMANTSEIQNVPRLSSPRIGTIPPGRVTLAGTQCGLQPEGGRFTSGWRIIGCSPALVMDFESDTQPVQFQVGDKLLFRAVDKSEWDGYRSIPLQEIEVDT